MNKLRAMKIGKMRILFFVWAFIIAFIGCAPPQKPVRAETPKTKPKTGIGVKLQSDFPIDTLIIYPDKSKGRRYDSYSAIVLAGKIVTMSEDENGNLKIIPDGRVVIVGEKIASVLAPGEKFPSQIDSSKCLFLDTKDLIFPGLINAHDHVHYNHIPLWDVQKTYTNRYQWPDEMDCRVNVKNAKNAATEKKYWNQEHLVVKYGEVKQLVGGTTSVQGAPSGSRKFTQLLVRNMDVSPNFGFQRMSSYVRNVTEEKDAKIKKWISKFDAGELDALFFHISEGTDEKARKEFDFLIQKGLARKEVIIIHGTALDEKQIKYMGEHKMTLVWSPVSNLLLYGKTAEIPIFVKYGVNICIGTDWSPSGGKNLLGEMKVAYKYSKTKWNGILSYQDICKMVTCNPADAVGWKNFVGRIEAGLYADIVVISDRGEDPYETLVKATDDDVRLVFVGGDPLYGDSIFMAQLKPGDFEYLQTTCGFKKCLDFTKENVPNGDETFRYADSLLRVIMSFDENAMMSAFMDKDITKFRSFSDYLSKKFPGYRPQHLDPIYFCMDPYFFNVLNSSKNAKLPFDIKAIYFMSGN